MEVLNRVDSLCEDITAELNSLGECVFAKLSDISWKFEEIEYVNSKITLFNENKLMLDEAYFPDENAANSSSSAPTTTTTPTLAWYQVAAGAAAYAYKTIGSKYSNPVRNWLTNAASTAIQYGLLGRYLTGINTWTPEGNWFSGKWTPENTASAEELKSAIDPNMSTMCINVIIAGILNYCQSNCYTPKSMSNYAIQLLHNGSMEKFGITNEHDKLLIMEITSQWCSRIKIIQLIESALRESWQLKSVASIGQCKLQLTPQIKEYFDFLPINWKDLQAAVCIAHKLVKSNCVYFADFHSQLIDIKNQLKCIRDNPFKYHCNCKYLLEKNSGDNNDNNNNNDKNNDKPKVDNDKVLFGRLITFLKYAEPQSQLFQRYKCLKCNGKTCEKQYSDYNKNWELIVQHIYNNEHSSSSIEETIKKLQELKLISNDFKIDEESVRSVRKVYNV